MKRSNWVSSDVDGAGLPSLPAAVLAQAGRLRRGTGDTLIEVMVALLLLALAALGTVALQSWVGRSQQSARWLDLAVGAAALMAEALRAGESAATCQALAGSTVADLPDGRAAVAALGDGQWRITVAWSEAPRWEGSDTAPQRPTGAPRGAECPAVGRAARVPHCFSLSVAR